MISKKPLINFIIWTISFLLICLIGASNVFADTTNIGYISNDTQVLVGIPNAGSPITLNQNTSVNNSSVNAIWFNINYNFVKDKLYQLEISTPSANLVNINTFGIEYNGGVCNFYGYSDANIGFPKIYFKCLQNVNYLSISLKNWDNNTIVNGSNFKWSYTYLRSFDDDDEIDLGPIISNQNQNTQDIINNQNSNNQNIINNNNQNTNKIIEENKKNFETCGSNLLDGINYINGNILQDGTYTANSNRVLTDYFKIKQVTYNYNISDYLIFYIIEYDYQKSFISRTQINNTSGTFTPRSNTEYLRISFRKSDNTDLSPQDVKNASPTFYSENDCTNKLDATKDAINGLDDTLKNDNIDDNGVSDAFESFNDFLDDNSTITQLITLPITLYTAILNNLNSTCSPFNLGQLYGENLILPCINISQYLGNSLWTMIDIIISGFAVYAISKKMIKVFNNFSSLREGDVIDD